MTSDGAYVPFFGGFGAAWDDAMVARWSANPLGMLWPEGDAAFVTSWSGNPPPVALRRPVLVIADRDYQSGRRLHDRTVRVTRLDGCWLYRPPLAR